ncbi:hypothetical protein HBH70_156760 [Parastagonospora nodorum]|nr:hypothetical protein HBH53_124140 [Parastagonospora nodorum]KAH4118974.1 hypothetical protein HBH47_132160 [Parastagonospora nodorum]KAH4204293.1 hypothetical protein HBI95_150800 [Parastagonospora nodorum]KAH5016076.1 hypothetical protein HBI74_172970 [Parastagonospora nodorum]KAH5097629.1 hypothetical protein HBH72_123140 [Parastagonospora nodorum]
MSNAKYPSSHRNLPKFSATVAKGYQHSSYCTQVVSNYGFEDETSDGPVALSWFKETREDFKVLSGCLKQEENIRRPAGTWGPNRYNPWVHGKRHVSVALFWTRSKFLSLTRLPRSR